MPRWGTAHEEGGQLWREGGLCRKTEGILSQRQRQYAISSWNLWRTPIPPTVANPQQQFTSPGIAAIRNSAHARACTIPLTTLKVFWKKGEGGFCNPTSYRDCRIFVIFWDLTRQDMCIRRTRRNMWMRWKVEHWSSNRFDASWCFPNLRHHLCKKNLRLATINFCDFWGWTLCNVVPTPFWWHRFSHFLLLATKKHANWFFALFCSLCYAAPFYDMAIAAFAPNGDGGGYFEQRRSFLRVKRFASSNRLHIKTHIHTDCICFTFIGYFEQRRSCPPLKSFASNERQ